MSDGPDSDSTTPPESPGDAEGSSTRRIRHITSIQVRNLTPFPVRDAFASALQQPSEQSQFTAQGHLSDDLDVALGRKRSRRISANSLNTLRSRQSEDGGKNEEYFVGSPELHRGRMRKGSKVSFSSGGSLGQGASVGSTGRTYSSTGMSPSVRPSNRPRTSSTVSSASSQFHAPSPSMIHSSSTAAVGLSTMLPDNSQKALEKVLNSRLVETFIAISIPASSYQLSPLDKDYSESPSTSRSHPSTPPHSAPPLRDKFLPARRKVTPAIRKGSKVVPTSPSETTKTSASPRRESVEWARTTAAMKSGPLPLPGSILSGRPNGKIISPAIPLSSLSPVVPNYLSPIHRPSTNPSFSIDARSKYEFAEWTDVSGERLKVEIWGKVGLEWSGAEDTNETMKGNGKGKGKERLEDEVVDKPEWKVLEAWDISLADLKLLPEDFASHPSHLPSNSLLITLAPHGRTYYLSPPILSSRPPSPSAGYNSDPESRPALRNVRNVGGLKFPTPSRGFTDAKGDVSTRARIHWSHRRNGSTVLKEGPKTAGWQDLLKLVTLQTCILDTEESLSDIVREIDKTLEEDVNVILKREVSERETRVVELRRQRDQVEETSDELREEIEYRRGQLRQRQETLSLAKEQLAEDISRQSVIDIDLTDGRNDLANLRQLISPAQTSIITTLSAIYPIELLSPPDLLFTILYVPLPIPLTPSDPGPPLSLPDHREVTEDAVSTALGYAAQVVQLLAAYLGKGLIYPVTCVGSKSLIRDGISSMVGPRMFPLFSKGVDTYRFEYGVFLLNKDIEMLMTDRDLRALDMRHTLPNLKNLLLTLTDGRGARLSTPRVINSPTLSTSGLESPRPKSPPVLELSPSSPHPAESSGKSGTDGSTPPSSGATTPTSSTIDPKSKSLLGLYPLSGFWRSRQPSVAARPSVKSVDEIPEGVLENSDVRLPTHETSEGPISADDDDDRRTIRGVPVDDSTEPDGKQLVNGHGVNGDLQRTQEEKSLNSFPSSTSISTATIGSNIS